MRCPDDHGPLERHTSPDMELSVCSDCSGVWFEERAFTETMAQFGLDSYQSVFDRWRDLQPRDTVEHHWQEDTRTCPQDRVCMRKREYAGDSGIYIDQCPQCRGFWIDGDELRRLWEYVRPDLLHDALARVLVKDMEESRRRLEEDQKNALQFVALIGHPSLLVRFLLEVLVKRLVDRDTSAK